MASETIGGSTRETASADPALARAEAELERTRERVAQSMLALRNEVARRTDWRRVVRERPLLCIGTALALGFWWGFRRGSVPVRGRPRTQ
jgi:ElaB/YqjD/DUF883 family membrane-anchored ribosome-binding protein